jgi:hypothetical protein
MDVAALRELVAVYDRPVEGSRRAVLDAIREHRGEGANLDLVLHFGRTNGEELCVADLDVHCRVP